MSTEPLAVARIMADPDWYEPYRISLGMRVGNLLFISRQAAQVFKNLCKVLENAGSSLSNVVKVTIFLTDMRNFKKIVALREHYFTPPYPADTIVEVSSLAHPQWMIEIDAIAVQGRAA